MGRCIDRRTRPILQLACCPFTMQQGVQHQLVTAQLEREANLLAEAGADGIDECIAGRLGKPVSQGQ